MSNRISALLSVALIALCAVIVMEVRSGVPTADDLKTSPAKKNSAPASGPVRLRLPPLAALSETVERPLFSDTRRPPEIETDAAPEIPAPVAAGPAPSFSVSAIVITENERAVLLTHPQSGDLTRVAEGETIAGWRLHKVESDRAVFTRDGETREAALRSFGPPPPRRGPGQTPGVSAGGPSEQKLRRTLNDPRLRPRVAQEPPASQR